MSALRSGIRGIRATPLIFALSVSSMAAGLLLLGTYLLVVQNMRAVARLVAKAAELRRDPLGVHLRTDAEPRPTEGAPCHLCVTRSADGPVFTRVPPDFGTPE